MFKILSVEESYFVPVAFGVGIVGYFSYGSLSFLLIASLICLFGFLTYYARYFIFVALCCLGYAWVQVKTDHIVDTKFIKEPIDNVVLKGTVESIEEFPKNQRITLSIDGDELLKKIRLRLWKSEQLTPGQTIKFKAHLLPFLEKPTPYSFDFKRDAFYKGINATGRVVRIIHKSEPQKRWIQRVRENIKQRTHKYISGPAKHLAVALTTGDKSGISQKIKDDFSRAGTSHILAISGLHLSLIAFFLIFFFQFLMSLIPVLHERYPVHKVMPVITWVFLLFYHFISGAGFPVQRAFIMISLFILGTIVDRRTISLYSVCLAAFFIMLIYPESIISVSFQLSFGAVLPIIALYERKRFSPWITPLISTVVASIGTLPFSITVFKYMTLQAITGNLLSLPLFSYIIMPLTMLSFLGFGYYFLEITLGWLTKIAAFTASLQWSHISVPATVTPYFLLFFIVGGLWVCLVQNKWRFGGILFILIAPLFYRPVITPNILVSPDGCVRAWKVNGEIYYTDNIRKGKFDLDEWEKVYAIRIFKDSSEHSA